MQRRAYVMWVGRHSPNIWLGKDYLTADCDIIVCSVECGWNLALYRWGNRMPLNLRDLGMEYCVWDGLLQIAIEKQPTSYLEVGTRYGDSLLRVLAGCKIKLTRITIADIWHESYFGANSNGTGFERGHKHVERFLTAMGYTQEQVTYLDGDSAVTIPTLDKKAPFDLVLIDGDHN